MSERKRFVILLCLAVISIALVLVMRANIGQEFIGQL